jgi:hypothetical protein
MTSGPSIASGPLASSRVLLATPIPRRTVTAAFIWDYVRQTIRSRLPGGDGLDAGQPHP